ncbi:Uu.00g069400.m01.CDS01 [Anthostomella pinea]|uniref:Uu.00g069400.m01.CDS01 n=1 Tax=Anthostomella pinea TaxID=933095 RepID=A0AAI8YNL6_9PEZI|nr:Uu.00g069400.m01.CDS01 [Anthostomella pinea]
MHFTTAIGTTVLLALNYAHASPAAPPRTRDDTTWDWDTNIRGLPSTQFVVVVQPGLASPLSIYAASSASGVAYDSSHTDVDCSDSAGNSDEITLAVPAALQRQNKPTVTRTPLCGAPAVTAGQKPDWSGAQLKYKDQEFDLSAPWVGERFPSAAGKCTDPSANGTERVCRLVV